MTSSPPAHGAWIRRANSSERCAAMPYLKAQCRSPRAPSVYCAGHGEGTPPTFVLGILPDAGAPFAGHCFQIELLALEPHDEGQSAILDPVLTQLAEELCADHLTTPLIDEPTIEASLFKSAGFRIAATSHCLANPFKDARERIADLNRMIGVWTKRQRIDLVPYPDADQDQVIKLHRSILAEIPEGHLVMNGEISSTYLYDHSYVAVKDGTCVGLMVNGVSGTEAAVETLLVTPDMEGTPLAAALVARFINDPKTENLNVAHYVVSSRNTQALSFVRSLGARDTHNRVKLEKSTR